MPYSYNGWYASPDLDTRPFVVAGASFPSGVVDNDDVYTVLRYVVEEFDKRVEPIMTEPGCWGYYFKPNTNDPSTLSCHASGTALDINAPKHPNGVPTRNTFSAKQIDTVHKILDEVDHVVQWGGDYNGTPDAMHFEIIKNAAAVKAAAQKIRNGQETNDMPLNEADKNAIRDIVKEEIDRSKLDVGAKAEWSEDTFAETLLNKINNLQDDVNDIKNARAAKK